MQFSTEQIITLIDSFPFIPYLASFLAPFLSGENGTVLLAFISAQGYFPLWILLIFSFIGMLTLDSFWFLMTRTRYFEKLKKWLRISNKYKSIEKRIEKMTGGKDIFILLLSKILIGTRILIIIYLSARKLTYRKFIFYNSISTFIWAAILCGLGWLAGKGFYTLAQVEGGLKWAMVFLIGVIIIIYGVLRIIRIWLLKYKK